MTGILLVQSTVAALVGLVFGSFVTVLIHRVPRKESILAPRSRCPSCGTTIRARENIPVVSYLLLGGRCRNCRARISPKYPLVELASAALWVGALLRFQDQLYIAAVMALFFTTLLAISVIDAEHRIVPNRIVYPALPGFAVLVLAGGLLGQLDTVRGALGLLVYGGGLLLVALAYPRGMGIGDVKLAALIGLVLGSLGLSYVTVAAAAGFFAGGLGGVVALATGRSRKTAIPFGPYLAAGAVFSALAGAPVAAWYLSKLR